MGLVSANSTKRLWRIPKICNISITFGSKRRYKETEEGQKVMCEIMERLTNKAKEEGAARVNTLNSILINLNRFDDLKRAATNKDFQMQLMIELLPEEI